VAAHARRRRRLFVLAAAAALLAAGPAAGAETDPTYAALRSAKPEGQAFAVQEFVLQRDVFRFTFESGIFQFLTPVDGRPYGAVFSGKATFELKPSTRGERSFLRFETNEPALETLTDTLRSAVLFFGDGTSAEIEEQGTAVPATPELAGIYEAAFKKEKTRWKSNLQIRLLSDALEPGAPDAVFLALFSGKKLSPALAAADPRGLEWLAPGVGTEGSILAVLEDGRPRLWYSSKLVSADPALAEPKTRATHYAIDTTIRSNTAIEATEELTVAILADGLRVLPIHLLDQLRIHSASFSPADGDSFTPLAVIQEHAKEEGDAAVVFPSPPARGRTIRLRFAYGGKDVLRDSGEGNYTVGARDSWYPNLGPFGSPASFELTYRCPKGNQVVSVGTLESDRLEGDVRVLRFRQDRPVRVAGFNYGRFQMIEREDHDSGMTIAVYTNTGTPDFIREMDMAMQNNPIGLTRVPLDTKGFADAALADGINMARVGTVYFGPLPDKRLAITQQTQAFFGQSWPSLVYLPFIAAFDSTVRHELGLQGASHFVDEVGPHEVAHQWWGHLVGWNTYRDQWLSEGFAQFSVSLVVQASDPKKLNPFWERARQDILSKPRGSSVASDAVGPISLGWRLSTRRNPYAYQALVYSKGAYVLHMLRMAMRQPGAPGPDARFIDMMQDFVESWADKNPTTKDFQRVVERHMTPAMDLAGDGRMDYFFRQWVDGMDIPIQVARLEIKKEGDQYRIKGTISQDAVPEDFRSASHLYADLGKGEIARIGSVRLTGKTTLPVDIALQLPKAPKKIVLNAMHDVLTRN
jgi:hypothetical protein